MERLADDVTGVVHAHDVEHLCGPVNAEDATVWHGTCLLSVNDCPRCCNHAGSSKPYGKEAGPFH
jgi:hypothetical protein